MTTEPIGVQLKRCLRACAGDPDKLAALETYINLLIARDDAFDDGDVEVDLRSRQPAIDIARTELRHLLKLRGEA